MATGFGEIAERLRHSTVTVAGGGSGVVWSADGSVITNAHVVRGPRATVESWDGRRWEAEVKGRNPRRDLAWLRVNAALEAPVFADSSQVQPGELVLAIGNPLGFTGALSTGVVHAVGPVSGLGRRPWIQAGVRLAPGNSGGPLADARGRVIGINAMVAGGVGLAIPSNTVADFMGTGGETARLGVVVRPVSAGLLVLEVERGSRAAAASLEPGDVLVGAEGRRFQYLDDLGEALENARGRVRLQFVRNNRLRDIAA
jgi:serine protease Do